LGMCCVVDLLGRGCGKTERGCVDVGNIRDMVKSSGGVVGGGLGREVDITQVGSVMAKIRGVGWGGN